MEYAGKWRFHSVGQIDDNGALVYMNAEEHLASPMPYIDETDEEAVADEIRRSLTRRLLRERWTFATECSVRDLLRGRSATASFGTIRVSRARCLVRRLTPGPAVLMKTDF